jgi:VCBS repeat-containing protein
VDDGNGGVRTEDAVILIRANSPPQAINDVATVQEDGGTSAIATGNLVANDPDLEGDPLSILEIRPGSVEGAGSFGVIMPTLGTANLFSDPGTGSAAVMARVQLSDPSQGRFEAGESAGITIISGDNAGSIVLSGTWNRLNSYLQSPGFKLSINPDVRDPVAFSAELFQQVNSSNQLGAAITGSAVQRSVLPPGAASALATYGSSALSGTYGKLLLLSNGSYAYTLNNSNVSVNTLPAGSTLSEVFTYTATDGTTSKTANLTITIQGTDDAPVAVADTASIGEAGGTANSTAGAALASTTSGVTALNVLTNDTDLDNGDSKTV